MTELLIIAALAAVVVGLCAYAAWSAWRRALRVAEPRDWREDWCVPECWAAHEQEGPCADCPARRMHRF